MELNQLHFFTAPRAISKDELGNAGLISCPDYYNERPALKLC